MPASQAYLSPETPLGATLLEGGATFRCWAPHASEVYVALSSPPLEGAWPKPESHRLVRDEHGIWGGFFPGVTDGDVYRFYVVGTGSEGFKRDPHARELLFDDYPDCGCLVRDPGAYSWRDAGFRPPPFHQLVVYQLHFGVYFAEDEQGRDIRRGRVATFLDAVARIEYLSALGVNAVMPLPFQEFQTESSLGYNGTDLFSPEMDYSVRREQLAPYVALVNRLLAAKGQPATTSDELSGQVNQLKTFVDLCHLYGIAVIADVVLNHAGGGFDDQSLYFFDRQPPGDNARSLYFTRDGHAGGLVFDYAEAEVRRFLIDNARAWLREYHIDGLRFDQVTVIEEHGGFSFCQELSRAVRLEKPEAVQIAEYWGEPRWRGIAEPPAGMGFDVGYSDVLRGSVRRLLGAAQHGRGALLDFDDLATALGFTQRLPGRFSTFQCIENHDLIYVEHADGQPRIARLADASNPRSWYARSRARVATGLLLTAPGVPMLFMGQEFLEHKPWSDWQGRPDLLLDWQGLADDRSMSDFWRFTRDLAWLRRAQPALCGDGLAVFHVHSMNRVIAFQRWVEGAGHDVVVVASLNESSFYDGSYRIGFPAPGYWREVFNSDAYDCFPNPGVQGNYGGVMAEAAPLHGLPASAGLTIPANSLLVFAR